MPVTVHNARSVFRVEDPETIRIGKTRVTLDSLAAVFNNGETPEQTQQDFPTLDLADIHAALAYYIRNRAEVDAFLEARDREAEEIARTSPLFSKGVRGKLIARRHASFRS
jgi:uncharacterized protein (DUF433 family)